MWSASELGEFGRLLRQYRVEAGLTQEVLAERAGLSPRSIHGLERGETRPHRSTAERLARALALSSEQRVRFLAVSSAPRRHKIAAPPQGSVNSRSPTQNVTYLFADQVGAVDPSSPAELPPNNLPLQMTSFVGRERELAQLRGLLASARLLTLTGTGGSGKTRLALAVAEQMLTEFADGVFFVSLAPLSDAGAVPSAIAQTLGIPANGKHPVLEGLIAVLRQRQLLLVLDNFEHLLEAAPVVTALLAACSRIKVLVTTRVALRLSGEQEYPVQPLALPDCGQPLEALMQNAAVDLFCQRAAAAQPTFALSAENVVTIVDICTRLDGLPLAIELAAARVKHFSPATLLRRLQHRLPMLIDGPRDAPVRQQAMRATLAWSDALLDATEQHLFYRLSVFAGGCTRDAAASVTGAYKDDPLHVERGLLSLADKSLVRIEVTVNDEPRFSMLEVVREYAWERLVESGEEEAVRRRHAEFFTTLAERAEPSLVGPEQAIWLERLAMERENLRAALAWTQEQGDTTLGLRLAGALERFWKARGYVSDERRRVEALLSATGPADVALAEAVRGRALGTAAILAQVQGDVGQAIARLEEALSLLRHSGDMRALGHALNQLGILTYERGDLAGAGTLHAESLEIQRASGDTVGAAESLGHLGIIAANQREYARATELYEESLRLHRQIGNLHGVAQALRGLGLLARETGDYDRAAVLYEESLAYQRALGERRGIAHSTGDLALIAAARGDDARAAALFEESLAIYRALGAKRGVAWVLTGLGSIASRQGNDVRATELFEESLARHREIGNLLGVSEALMAAGFAANRRGDRRRALAHVLESLSLCRQMGDPVRSIRCLEGLAEIAAASGEPLHAARLFGAATAARALLRSPSLPFDRSSQDVTVSRIRATLGEAAFVAAWSAGTSLSLTEALAEAVEYASAMDTSSPE